MNEECINKRGRVVMDLLSPRMSESLNSYLKQFDKTLPALITDYAFGSVIARDGLDLKTREMITVASLISLGNATPQLELHFKTALNVGVTKKELLEIIIQMAVYAGVPAFMNALEVFRRILNSARENNTL
ncbi:carboxymuconolactone decarboxylase family protein [Atlantibacter subterranea]|uniref:carboxymuconolactone decarboxylase family protein n=1 Tax=Atlantibacter subterraneus TaxID=255519 RepID=UPI0020C57336|nr:carboxymuconolactone decarboxylase family protein [Atlantibacter subterranea]UTJ46769.1 carboxymuconolactone decarboxylase family protein [Atlantibacter subterranea]